jgi:hypothetical protein
MGEGIQDRTQRGELVGCPHGNVLSHMRSGAVAAGLFVKASGTRQEDFLASAEAELKSRWPSCIIFMENGQLSVDSQQTAARLAAADFE